MNPTVKLRPETDHKRLIAWRREVVGEVFGITPDTDTTELMAANERFYTKHIADGSHIALVAAVDGHDAGCGAVCIQEELPSPDNPTGICAYLMNIYVRPPFRKQGVATAIVKRLTAIASDRRAGKIYLETTGMARRMYASVGFSEMDGMMILTRRPSSQSESNENRTTKR